MNIGDIHFSSTIQGDIKSLYEILKEYPDFFDDSVDIDTYSKFETLFYKIVKDSLTLTKNNEVVGCIYLDTLDDKFATYNIIFKRRSIHPKHTSAIVLMSLQHFFEKHNVVMIGSIIRVNNFAVLRVAKQIGAVITGYIPKYEKIKGQLFDCVYAGILREALV